MIEFQRMIFVLNLFFPVLWASYDDAYQLERFLFANYSTRIPPVHNHSQPIEVTCSFQIGAIVDVNEIQSTLCSIGGLNVSWVDEKLQWNPSEHGDITHLHPYPKDVWRPRLQLVNSYGDIDVFEDDYHFLVLYYTGHITWVPGAVFPSLCKFNLMKFPFDEHTCDLVFRPIFTMRSNIILSTGRSEVFDQESYEENGEWALKKSRAHVDDHRRGDVFMVSLTIARRPISFIVNLLIPVVLLSVLNLLSFTMEVGDGSVNIGHSMTVLLAYTIYMSILIDHLPSVSLNMPYLTFYLFILFVISLLTTIDIVFIVWLHNKEEMEEKKQKRESKKTSVMNKLVSLRWLGAKKISPFDQPRNSTTTQINSVQLAKRSPSNTRHGRDWSQGNTKDNMSPAASSVLLKPFPDDAGNADDAMHQNGDVNSFQNDSDKVPYDVAARHGRVNRYKNMSEKVRIYSLYIFMFINFGTACLACTLLAS